MSTDTVANGVAVRVATNQSSTPGRRLAAQLERGGPNVDWVESAVCYDAKVKLDPDSDVQRFDVPDGWSVDNVFMGANGSAFLRLNRDD